MHPTGVALKTRSAAAESSLGGRAMRAHAETRFKKRLPCKVKLGASEYSGMIMNLSRSGLFVQTGAVPGPGDVVEVELRAPLASPDLVLQSRVVWKQLVPHPLRHRLVGGIGLQIEHAPESYYSLVEAVERLYSQVPRAIRARSVRENAAAPPAGRMRFRIELQQIGGTRSRIFEVDAESETDARRSALDLAGPDWSITRISPLA
jgi:hypothetical protein